MIKFKRSGIRKLIASLKDNYMIEFVSDHGVYLMTFAQKDVDRRVIVYAEGLDPRKDPDWYDLKIQECGGNDFGAEVGPMKDWEELLKANPKGRYLYVRINPDKIITSAFPDLK